MNKSELERFINKTIIEIDAPLPSLKFSGNGYLTIECHWRLRDNKTILIGSLEYKDEKTHDEYYEKLTSLLIGKEIKKIQYIPPVSDLIIEFEKGLLLELFSDSNIYESWNLSDGEGFELISLPGGKKLEIK